MDLSSFYLDVLKDRLYTEARESPRRRCAQSVMYVILNSLVRVFAPVLCVTCEEVWQLMREAGWVREASVHLALWPSGPDVAWDGQAQQRWATVLALRAVVMKALEAERAKGIIGSPLEARVTLHVSDARLQRLCEGHREMLAEAFVVSSVVVNANGAAHSAGDLSVPGLSGIQVERAPGAKCQRCWKHLTDVGSNTAHPTLCARCAQVVTGS